MTLQEIDAKLTQVKDALAQWIDQGYTPTIEKMNALLKLQEVYDALCDGKPVPTQKPIEEVQVVENKNIVPEQRVEVVAEPTVQKSKPVELVLPKVETPQMVLILGQKISVQQRETFVRELFWRDEAFFANEIRKFQEIRNLDDALIYIGEKYNWAAGNSYAEQFISMLENYYK